MATSSKSMETICVNQVDGADDNVLAQHASFFDRNHDGRVFPWETYEGLRAIGCSKFVSVVAGIGFHLAFSIPTRKGKFPNPFFPIEIQNIPKAKHGSDSGVYDSDGKFVQEKFDKILGKHIHLNKNGLNILELQLFVLSNKEKDETIGWILSFVEWNFLYFLANKKGILEIETIRGMFDGTLFQQMEEDKKSDDKRKDK